MSRLSDTQITTTARRGGFVGGPLEIAIAVCLAESAGDPHAVNTYGNTPPSRDRGLWQINDHYHPEVSDADAFDPIKCAVAAYRISDGGSNWRPWSTFNSGSYKQFIPRARAAARGSTALMTFALDRLLHVGCTGNDVRELQRAVGAVVDGVFGPKTQSAVMSFQRAHHLAQDGIVGPSTAHALGWRWVG